MARDIEATPTLYGEDAKRFLEEMKKPATKEHKAFLKEAEEVYKAIKVYR
ncbi:MAG: hypothetical protein LBU40_06845 [Methanobrevibacter sp.]|jgi:hypothetical protein|nr:hypothetical protein [Methanobrevibacter sp.]